MELWQIFLLIGGVVLLQFPVIKAVNVLVRKSQERLQSEEFTARLPRNVFFVFLIPFLMFGSGAVLMLVLVDDPPANYIIFAVFLIISLVLAAFAWRSLWRRVRVTADGIKVYPAFAPGTAYAYGDIKEIEELSGGVRVLHFRDGKTFKVRPALHGYRQLLLRLQEKTGLDAGIPPDGEVGVTQ